MSANTYSRQPLAAAACMVGAGASFAIVNLCLQGATMLHGLPASSAAFWQYFVAFLFALPLVLRGGLRRFTMRRTGLHALRVVLAVGGVQAWAFGLAHVPIWQAIALVMTSPFFVIAGARLFLGEAVSPLRWLATLTGFAGGMILLAPWSDDFVLASLLPVLAAALWGGASLVTKRLTGEEEPETVTLFLLMLLTPANALMALADGGTVLPQGWGIGLALGAGLFTVSANYLLTLAYARADAAFVQPFDHLKLPLNILAGWLAFGFAPEGYLWPGAALILAGSFLVLADEKRSGRLTAQVA